MPKKARSNTSLGSKTIAVTSLARGWHPLRSCGTQLGDYTMKPAYSTEAVEPKDRQSTGNRLKFKLEFMLMMLNCDRTEEAGKMYNQLIEEFDKLA